MVTNRSDDCSHGVGLAPKMLAAGNQDARIVVQVLGFMAPSRPAGVIGALPRMAERPDVTTILAQIAVPTLVITGADDTLIPAAESETLDQAIRDAQLKVIPHAGPHGEVHLAAGGELHHIRHYGETSTSLSASPSEKGLLYA
jgi:pimeloyl-ACP methyl ester carboxylesterase